MTKFIYSIDEKPAMAEEFRAQPQRVEAENFLINAYQKVIGHMICPEHKQAPGYALKFFTESGECKISTLACCPEFDAEINTALLHFISENDPDKTPE